MSESTYNHKSMYTKKHFDSEEETFYPSFYFENCKYIFKIPPYYKVKKKDFNIKIDKFSLSEHIYLINFE